LGGQITVRFENRDPVRRCLYLLAAYCARG